MKPDVCPNCGELVPDNAKSCPECGSCEETGWSDDARADQLGIPADSFDYDEYVKREFEGEKPKRKLEPIWVVTAIALLGAMAWFMFGR